MKCAVCGKICADEVSFCGSCGSPFLKETKEAQALSTYLLSEGIIKSPEELCRTVSVKLTFGSDDGLIPMNDPEESLVCPLYYTQKQVLDAMVRKELLSYTDFHYIAEFMNYPSVLGNRMAEKGTAGPRPRECGDFVLAEVLPDRENPVLRIVYQHRAEMVSRVSRSDPMACLYGCPVSSELEEQYRGVNYHTELVHFDDAE